MSRKKMTEQEKIDRNKRMELKQNIEKYKRIMKESFDSCMAVLERGDVKEPTYFFNIGDRVSWGNWDWVHILDVIENGKIYKILKITSKFSYGRYAGEEISIIYALWVDVRPYNNNDDKPIFLENKDIQFNYSQRDMYGLLHSFYSDHAGIDCNPDYQRDLVWTQEQKISLIDSIFRNIDIGKFTFIKIPFEENRNYYLEVLDGKQRINTLIEFYECRFKYNGSTYNDLHQKDKNHFLGYNVSWAETDPLTSEQKYRYFLKLNVGGTPIDKKHIDKVLKMWEDSKSDEKSLYNILKNKGSWM